MFDVAVRDLGYRPQMYRDSLWQMDYQPDFQTEIRPILERGAHYPWVVAIPPKPHRFDYDLLGDPDPQYNGMRQYYLGVIRPPNQQNAYKSTVTGYPMMPFLAGDDATGSSQKSSKFLKLTDTQYFLLQQWASGNFTNHKRAKVSQNPAEALTRAVLEKLRGRRLFPRHRNDLDLAQPQVVF